VLHLANENRNRVTEFVEICVSELISLKSTYGRVNVFALTRGAALHHSLTVSADSTVRSVRTDAGV